jgi:SAM-dependent methyltransferase
MDLAPSAVRLSRERTAAAGLQAEFVQGDFLRSEADRQFDWLYEHTCFCAIQPEERELYMQAVKRWLKPGGNFLGTFYLIDEKDGPPFGTTREELIRRFSGFELVKDWVPRSYPNRTGLELMMWWRRSA